MQAVVEQQLEQTIKTARKTFDKVTHKNYVADSGAVVVMDAKNGRVVAMAGAPTYNPKVWVGGITSKQLGRLYSAKADNPLLFRATQGQFAPGSTWKPIMTTGALNNGFSPSTRLDCSSGFQVGNRWFKNYESASYGSIGFDRALQISCDTFFYRVGYRFWQKYGTDEGDVNAKDPLVKTAKLYGFGKPTGIDLPGEASGRIADRHWKRAYWEANKSYYCKIGKKPGNDFLHVFAREFCVDGYAYRAGDAVNYVIGQGDTLVTPLQSARAYAALANGGTLYEPRVAKAIVGPNGKVIRKIKPAKVGRVKLSTKSLRYVDQALLGTAKTGTTAWKFIDFPLDKVHIRSKTGSAEVHGKQSTSWVASYDKNYVVLMMVTQAGTGSGTSGPGRPQDLGGALRRQGHEGRHRQGGAARRPDAARPAGVRPGRRDPAAGGPHGARCEGEEEMSVVAVRPRSPRPQRQTLAGTTTRVKAARLDWVLMLAAGALLAIGALLVWSATSTRDDLTAGDPDSYFKKQLVNIAIGVVLGVMVAATDHRWVRILAPLVYVASVIGLVLVLVMGSTINGSRSWIQARRHVRAAGRVRQARRGDRHGPAGGRTDRGVPAHQGGALARRASACSRSPACPRC